MLYRLTSKLFFGAFCLFFLFACKSKDQKTVSTPVQVVDTISKSTAPVNIIDTNPVFKQFIHELGDSIPVPQNYVSDYDDLFTPAQEDSLNKLIAAFEKKTTNQVAVVTFKAAMVRKENFDNLTLQLAQTWGVGQEGKDNGILVGICKDCKKIRIQNGKAIEKYLSDSATQIIVNEDFLPPFKEGKYFTGVWKGTKALISKLNEYGL